MKTFEQYLSDNFDNGITEFSLVASTTEDGYTTTFYIHPSNVSGDTMDFEVNDDVLTCLNEEKVE